MKDGSEELRQHAASLGRAASRVIPEANAVLKRGAQSVKAGLQDNLVRSRHFRQAAASISYDQVGPLAWEIGPDKSRFAGPLANIAFFGTSRGGGTVDLEGPLREEIPVVEDYLGRMLEDLGGDL